MFARFSGLILAVSCWLSADVCAQTSQGPARVTRSENPGLEIAAAALAQVGVTTIYDPAYVKLAYPGGDVPMERGVCCDVVVRALRKIGVDLQKLVHEDMAANFAKYPKIWGLSRTDRNIDHRRVPNLQKFFERRGKALPLPGDDTDYRPGDVVAWRFPNNLYHIGIVVEGTVPGSTRPWIVHNVGSGAQREDVLRAWKIIGHYRW
jgi:hypothetical protein